MTALRPGDRCLILPGAPGSWPGLAGSCCTLIRVLPDVNTWGPRGEAVPVRSTLWHIAVDGNPEHDWCEQEPWLLKLPDDDLRRDFAGNEPIQSELAQSRSSSGVAPVVGSLCMGV